MPLLAPAPPPDYPGSIRTLGTLAGHLEASRARLGLTTQQQAKQVGVSLSTLTKLYRGSNPQLSTVLLCLRWLAANR